MRRNEDIAVIVETLSAAIHNANGSRKTAPTDMKVLIHTASEQKVLPLVVEALHGTAEGLDGFAEAKRMAKRQVTAQVLRSERFLEIYNRLFTDGVTPLAVKGILCRSVYPKGDLRPSADEDVFVGDAQFSKSCEILRTLGLTAVEGSNEAVDDEVTFRTADGILTIELHRTLFPTNSPVFSALERFFADAFSHPKEYEVAPGQVVLSLNEHDHLLYLILHAFKHFIYSGFGIRQVCDIGLWAERYRERIDWELLRRQTACVRADVFAACVFQIAREHLGMELKDAWDCEGETSCEKMLEDMMSGGIYGTADRSRLHSASLTFRTVETGSMSLSGTIFPPRKMLLRAYPELEKKPFLLPVIWCKRLIKYRREVKSRSDSKATESIKIAQKRKEMLHYYHII